MPDWMSSEISDTEESESSGGRNEEKVSDEQEEASERSDFEKRVRTLLARDAIEKISLDDFDVENIDDPDVLQRAKDTDNRPRMQEVYDGRLADLGVETTDEEDNTGTEEAEPEPEPEPETTEEAEATEPETESKDPEPVDEQEEQTEAEEEPVAEEPETNTPTDEDEEPDKSPEDVVATTAAVAMADEAQESEDDSDSLGDFDDGADPEPPQGVDVKSIAPDVMTVTEAAEKDPRYTLMLWADPGQGKTHASFTMPSPVVMIDTEGKSDELAHKFDEGQYDDPFIFQPSDYDEAVDALQKAIKILDAYREQEGVIGTIVVDSMSVMWGWSQQKYVEKYYPGRDVEDVDFQTGFGSGKSDWKQIKNFHNVKFRQVMLDTPYHLCWTAMREDDYDAALDDDERDADKPAGEKENIYKVDEIIRLQEGPDGAPVGELQKSGKVKHRYTGLRYPTFGKHKEIIEAIDAVETGRGSIKGVEDRFNIRVAEGNPRHVRQENED